MSDLYLLRSTLKDMLRPRKLAAAGLLALLPAVIAVFWRFGDASKSVKPAMIYDTLESRLVFGFILVILAVVFGTGAISQEIEQRTISYLLTRPVPRWRILLVKFAAAIIAITVTVWVASLLLSLATIGPAGFAHSRLGRDCIILPVGALAYGAVFLLLAALMNRALLVGLVFAFGWESWAPDLPGAFRKVSLMSYLRTLAPHADRKADSVTVSKMLSDSASAAAISPSLAHWVLGVVIVIALGLALVVFSVREYAPQDTAD